MIDQKALADEREALERQRRETAETLARIDGALQLVRHLEAKCAARVRVEEEAAASDRQCVGEATEAGA